MGFFKKTVAEREEKRKKKESHQAFMGKTTQPIGKIAMSTIVDLSLDPYEEVLKIISIDKELITITLPYERIRGFKIENEVTLAKSGGTVGRALAGGALFGGAGAIVGGMSGKGKTASRWFGTLTYVDKEGNIQELVFIHQTYSGDYNGKDKHWGASKFEEAVNKVYSRHAEEITEL